MAKNFRELLSQFDVRQRCGAKNFRIVNYFLGNILEKFVENQENYRMNDSGILDAANFIYRIGEVGAAGKWEETKFGISIKKRKNAKIYCEKIQRRAA